MISIVGTHIKNDKGELLDLYLAEAKKQGYELAGNKNSYRKDGDDFVMCMNKYTFVQSDVTHDEDSKEITLSDLRAQLDTSVEWKDGDIVFIGHKEVGRFVGVNPMDINDCFVLSHRDGNAKGYHISQLSKPLTPAQIAEKAREAEAIRLHDIATKAYFDEKGMDIPIDTTWEYEEDAVRAMWFAVVDDKEGDK